MIHAVRLAKANLTMTEGVIVRWLKNEGDAVAQDETLFEVESDKAVIEVPSFYTGVVLKIVVEAGSEVAVGAVLAYIGEEGDVWSEGAAIAGE